jgi:hypothetical protein
MCRAHIQVLVAIKKMKKILIILTFALSLKGFAQFEYIDQSELYLEYNIKEVNAYEIDSGQTINDERWVIDKNGRIYSHKLLETEDDSSFSLDKYFFENNQLIKTYDIGIWNTRTNKVDTVTTIYNINENGQAVSSIYSNTRNSDTLRSIFKYNGNLLSSRVFYDAYSRVRAIDSMFYYSNLTTHILQRSSFFPEFGYDNNDPVSKKITYYDTLGLINLELEFNVVSNGKLIPVRSKSFVYETGKLKKTIKLYLGTYEFWGSEMRKTEEFYYYDKKGFVIKKEWYSNNKSDPYLVYTYVYK